MSPTVFRYKGLFAKGKEYFLGYNFIGLRSMLTWTLALSKT